MPAYTPFLGDVGQMLGAGERRRTEADLAGSAYMGDEQAMQRLMRTNPQLGIKIQQKKRQEQQSKLKQAAGKRDIYQENRELIDDIFKQAAKIEDYEQAKAYIQRKFDESEPILGDMGDSAEFTREVHEQVKTVYGEDKEEKKIDKVQSSNILPDGTVQLVRQSGAVEVVTPEQANVEKIKAAQEYGAELQGLRAGERVSATNAQKESAAAFKDMVGVRKTISLYDEGIRLLGKEGANTGPVESMFKSFKAATVELENVQARLGLNVIQNTTFGSLSDTELKFALNSAMPVGLDAPELKDWLERKRIVQMKLADYLEEAAIFLGEPGKGHSISDFIRQKKTQQFARSKPPEGKTGMSDNDYAARKKALGL